MNNSELCPSTINPCKICLDTVTPNSGVQCKGACKTWVHYKCLNYTPGKINDIKTGYIQINCPCPDCKTTDQKEIVSSSGHGSCGKDSCPANTPPRCENIDCAANKNRRTWDNTCGEKQCDIKFEPYTPQYQPSSNSPSSDPPTFNPPKSSPLTCNPPKSSPLTCNPPPSNPPCKNDSFPHPTQNQIQPQPKEPDDVSKRAQRLCKGGCMAPSGDKSTHQSTIEDICNKVVKLTLQINELMEEMKSAFETNKVDCSGNIRRVGFKSTGCNKGNCKTRCPPLQHPCPDPCSCDGNKNNKMMKVICDFRKKITKKLIQ